MARENNPKEGKGQASPNKLYIAAFEENWSKGGHFTLLRQGACLGREGNG